MVRPIAITVLLLAGCGELRSLDAIDAPVAILEGDIVDPLPQKDGARYRAQFGWIALGADQSGGQFSLELISAHDQVVNSTFINSFHVPLYGLPPESSLLHDEDGGALAFGGVVIYDDENENGDLDWVDPTAPAGIDRVVASSLRLIMPVSIVVFRSGPMHPILRFMQEAYGCPPVPEGLNIIEIDTDGYNLSCKVVPDGRIKVRIATEVLARNIACGPSLWSLSLDVLPPDRPPSATSFVECVGDGTSYVTYEERGHYCDALDNYTYSLFGPTWDLLRDEKVPAWWPCPIDG